jgi:predicted metal-dependent phosphoesterase TrpH
MQDSCKGIIRDCHIVKIDLHVHSSERSTCGQAGEVEQVKAAVAAGLDAIVFTDHGKLAPSGRLNHLNQQFAPFRVFGGIEISLEEDFLVVGLQDRELEMACWTYPELHAYTRQYGGYLILAHPFRYHPGIYVDIEQFHPDGIEIYSVNTPPPWQTHIRELSQKHHINLFSNSDAHNTSSLGFFYNEIPGFPASDLELVQALRRGIINTSPA